MIQAGETPAPAKRSEQGSLVARLGRPGGRSGGVLAKSGIIKGILNKNGDFNALKQKFIDNLPFFFYIYIHFANPAYK
jgi:hypothetical protein